ncbi:hypothetical protein CGMCC3_g16440 [Colletotrichum fructicola]|nr:uncharacterized protein CGMCC3_g16440 [Colletotrichum fructicola]KAE9567460.1 hypothetical protein CGMCC3_g16440 [Colletotrichum fructicola]
MKSPKGATTCQHRIRQHCGAICLLPTSASGQWQSFVGNAPIRRNTWALNVNISPTDSGQHTRRLAGIDAQIAVVCLDAECPLTRRLLPKFRALWEGAPAEIAPKLTVDFPCDAEDGFCAWGEVDVREQNVCAGGGGWGAVERQGPIVPRFEVVARGRQRFNETSCGA